MAGRLPTRSAGRRSSTQPNRPAAASTDTPRMTRSRVKAQEAGPTAHTSTGVNSGSASSIPTPTKYDSENDSASTPPTSDANTPNSVASVDGPSKLPSFQPASSLLKLQIELPDRAPSSPAPALAPDSMKALSKSKYALTSKRACNVFGDSDEEDDDEMAFLHVEQDAVLARKLQREEDSRRKASSPYFEAPSTHVPIPSGRFTLRSEAIKLEASKKRAEISDSDQDPLSITSDAEVEGPPAKKRKTAALPKENASPPPDPASDSDLSVISGDSDQWLDEDDSDASVAEINPATGRTINRLGTRRQFQDYRSKKRAVGDRDRLESQHPIFKTMWKDLEAKPILKPVRADQPPSISRNLKPFQLDGLAWMSAIEKTDWKGGLLGDEMGLGKTIQAVSLIMSDYPAKKPTLVLVPPVALMQWTSEIAAYTDGCLKTFVFHGTNAKTKGMTVKDIKKYDVIIMSYNSLESAYRKQEKGFARKEGIYKEKSTIHQTHFHRVILDEAHCIKTRSTMTARACFALEVDYRWCLTGTPLQNRIGEFFSLLRFLKIDPFANYVCRDCKCSKLEWGMDDDNNCTQCKHRGMRHVSVFNQELLNPIQRYGNLGPGKEAFRKLRLLTDRVMLRRLKKDHTDSMELPVKDVVVDRQFFSEVETDFANSIMTNSQRKFSTYVENGVMLNNYANIFGLIMQMRQVADHPDLILRKNSEGSQNILVCSICDEPAEDAIRSKCKHDFCRECAKSYLQATDQPDCPRCHIPLAIDLEQPEMEQDELLVKKSSIINRIRMENWTSSSKIELLVHNLYQLRSDKASHKSIIFSQFTTMLQLIEWRLRRAGITTVMLDGSMTPAQRQASIEYFKTNVDVECFLVSLKAGGVALNLTEASRVFIVDPWWNPAAEWQSADRCHRIGQTRPCIVTRLCIEDSVESRMVLLQEKKTRMINSTINSDDAAMESLTPEDLQFLFRGT